MTRVRRAKQPWTMSRDARSFGTISAVGGWNFNVLGMLRFFSGGKSMGMVVPVGLWEWGGGCVFVWDVLIFC